MDKTRLFLAKRYAQACLNVVYDLLTPADIEGFERVSVFFKKHQHACFLMDLSLLSDASKEQALQTLIEKYKLPAFSKDFFLLIIHHKRSALLAQILFYFVQLYRERAGILCFSIESSLTLSDEQKEDIEQFLKSQLHASVTCSYSLNKNLIAGIRIHNEKYLWEHSAQAQLRALYTSVKR